MDEETEAGRDWRPPKKQKRARGGRRGSSSDSDSDSIDGDEVGVAATPRSMRTSRGQASNTASRPKNPAPFTRPELDDLTRSNHQLLKVMPDRHIVKLLRLLRTHNSSALTRHVLTTYFVTGRSDVELDAGMTLLKDKPQEINLMVKSLASPSAGTGATLRRLSLSGLTRLDPTALASALKRCDSLEELVLKGCVQVNSTCVAALTSTASRHTLRIANYNFTDIGLEGFTLLASKCSNLEVLKLASVTGLTDKSVPEALRKATETAEGFPPLAKLRTLKLRKTGVGPLGISACVQLCGKTLENLDVSSLGLMTESGIRTLGAVLGVQHRSQHADSSYDLPPFGSGRTQSTVLPSSPLRPQLRKLNLSSNFAHQSTLHIRSQEATYAIEYLMRYLLPAFADTLEVLLLDDLAITGVEWDVLEGEWWPERKRREAEREETIESGAGTATGGALDGIVIKTEDGGTEVYGGISTTAPSPSTRRPLAALRRLSLSGNQPSILRWLDLWRLDYLSASPTDSPRLMSGVEELDLSRIDLRSSTQARFRGQGGSAWSYYQRPAGHNTEDATPPCPRSWANLRKLDLSGTQLGDRELDVLRTRLCPALLRSAEAGTTTLGTDDETEPHAERGWVGDAAPWELYARRQAERLGEPTGEAPLRYEKSALRSLSLAGTNVSGEGVKRLVAPQQKKAPCPYVEVLDLTGCRGVAVRERRGIWDVIEAEAQAAAQ